MYRNMSGAENKLFKSKYIVTLSEFEMPSINSAGRFHQLRYFRFSEFSLTVI